jgi:shikimate kinase
MKTNVALIGFMGAGKTEVGKALAKKLGREFVEMDALIESRAGKSVAEIFQQGGEIAFRELEIAVTADVARGKDQVIACGGGIVLNKINVDRLKPGAVIVYLAASPGAIARRTKQDKGIRPLLNVSDRTGEIGSLLRFRKPLYENAADITINTSRMTVAKVVEKIVDELKKHESSR